MACNHNHAFKINQDDKTDPTRSKVLRDKYSAEMYKRFREIKGLIRTTIVDNDAFNLTKDILSNAEPARSFEFTQDNKKVKAFINWLQKAEDDEILEVIEREGRTVVDRNEWQNKYIRAAYKKGYQQSTTELKKAGFKPVEYSSLQMGFSQPMHADSLGMLYTRNFNELQGITEAMDQQISRELAEGFSKGLNPRRIAAAINDRVQHIGITRGRVLARTEVIRAHAEATLNRYEEAGVKGVELQAEWNTAGDSRVCSTCKDLAQAGPYNLDEARGMIPAHPRCRCSWIPINENIE